VNEYILRNTETVRVIGHDGQQIGILRTSEALSKAKSLGLDLVEVSPNAKPPVCRVMDYGRYKYEEAKKNKASKAKQHVVKTKEIKLHPKTDINDYTYRLERGKTFLAKGYKLKATVVFRGREMAHMEYGGRWLKQMEEDLKGISHVDSPIKQEGRNMSIIFSPLKVGSKQAKPETVKVKTGVMQNAQDENAQRR
jgi:translation initiation factor IF-3